MISGAALACLSVTEPPELPVRFQPRRRASRARRGLLYIAGPLAWVVALFALAVVLKRFDAVEYTLLVLAGSFVVGLGWHVVVRFARMRQEQDA
jgi:hypothetical protein